MITLAVTLLSVWFYFLFGWVAAVRNLPRAWVKARSEWSMASTVRGSVKAMTICMLLFWPFYIPGRAVGAFFGHFIDSGDPQALEDKIRAQQKRIAELEREAGIR